MKVRDRDARGLSGSPDTAAAPGRKQPRRPEEFNYAELLTDVAVRITLVTDLDAKEMLRSVKTFPLLDGYRGAPPCDVAAVEGVLLRLGALVEAHPEVAELDANPVVARPEGALILDARVRLSAAPPRRSLPALRS